MAVHGYHVPFAGLPGELPGRPGHYSPLQGTFWLISKRHLFMRRDKMHILMSNDYLFID